MTQANDALRQKTGQTTAAITQQLDSVANASTSMLSRLQRGMRDLQGSVSGLTNTLRGLATGFGVILGVQGIAQFIRSVVDAGLQSQRWMRTLQAATGSLAEARRAMAFVVETSNQLGQSIGVMIPAFSQLAAATKNTALEGQRTRALFTSLVGAGQAAGLSTDAVGRAMVGLIQIISQNAIQLDEFRNQFASQIPGAMLETARALKTMGVTVTGSTAEMLALIAKQKLSVNDLIQAVTMGLGEIQKRAPEMSKTVEAAFQQLSNAMLQLKADLANSGLIEFLAEVAREAARSIRYIGQLMGASRVSDEQRLIKMREELIALGKLRASIQEGADQPAGILEQLRRFVGESPAEQLKNLDAEILRVRADYIALDKAIRAGAEAQKAADAERQKALDTADAELKKAADAEKAKRAGAESAAAQQKALVGLTSARMQQEEATLANLQSLRDQALQQDYQAAIAAGVKTKADLEAIEKAFLIRKADLAYQAALEEADMRERVAREEFAAKTAAAKADVAAAQAAATGPQATVESQRKANTQLAALKTELATFSAEKDAAMQAAAKTRIDAEIAHQQALTGVVVREVEKRAEVQSLAPAQALAGTIAQLEQQARLIEAQVKGEVLTRAEGAKQIEANNASIFALTEARLRREAEIKIALAGDDADARKLIELRMYQELGQLAQQHQEDVQKIYNAGQAEYEQMLKRNTANFSAFILDTLNILVDHTKTFTDFFQSILVTLRQMFFKFLADLAAMALAKPITLVIAGLFGGTTEASGAGVMDTLTAQVGKALGLTGTSGATGGKGLFDVLGFTSLFMGFKTALGDSLQWLTDTIGGAASTIAGWFGLSGTPSQAMLESALVETGAGITPVGTTAFPTGTVLGGAAALGGGLYMAITAENLGAMIGGAVSAAAGAAAITSGILLAAGTITAATAGIMAPIALGVAALAAILGPLIGGMVSPKGPRLAIGGLGGLGIGTEGDQLTLTGELTSQVQRAERLEGVDTGAIQSQLAESIMRLVQGMVDAINEVAIDPTALAAQTSQALQDALSNAMTINSSNAKKMSEDVKAQLSFVPIQIASYFLAPLNEAFRQLETEPLDVQLERLPGTVQGLINMFTQMNERLNELAGVANTDVLRQLSEVRNRVEDFGNALADTARVISTSIVDQTLSQLEDDVTAMIDLPLAERIIEFAGLFQDSLRALATLRFTADQISGAGLDATGVEAQWTRLAEAVMTEAGTVAEEIVTAAIADMADILAQMGAVSVRTQASMVASLFEDSVLALQALWSVWHQLASQEVDTTGVVEQFNRLWYDTIANLDTLVKATFDQGTFAEFLAVVIAIPPELAAMSEELAELRNTAIAFAQVVGPIQEAIDGFTSAMETPADVIARTAAQMAELDAAIAAAGDDVSLVLPLYAQMGQAIVDNANAQIAQLQQIGAILDQITAIQFGEMTSLEQFASLQEEITRILAEATVTGTTPEGEMFTAIELTTEQLAEIVNLYAQQLDVLQQLTSAVEASLESIEQTFFAQMSPQEQMASLQEDMNEILQDIAETGAATPDQLMQMVEITQQALALQQEITRMLEATLEDLQATLFEAQSPALQIQQVQDEINTLMAKALAGTATPEELQRLVDLNQQLLALGQQNDLLDIQQQALQNLEMLEPLLEGMIEASKSLEEQLLTQLEALQTELTAWLEALNSTEEAILATLEYQQALLEAQLLNDYGTTSIDQAILTVQQQAIVELEAIQEDLKALYDSLGLIEDILSAPAPNELPPGAATNAELQAITQQTAEVVGSLQKVTANGGEPAFNTRVIYMVGAQQGGYVGLASGGFVPAMLEPGERVFLPPVPGWAAAMNRAIPRFGGGGFTVPGSGSGDIVPSWLPSGAFVMNREASHAVGFQGGGTVSGGRMADQRPIVIHIHQVQNQSTRELVAEISRQLRREYRSPNDPNPWR